MTQYKPLRIWTGTEWIEIGHPGPQGASAYEIAVANGFVGSEVEWLASLEADNLTPPASTVSVVTTNFENILDSGASTVQAALEQIDANVAAAADGGFWATRPPLGGYNVVWPCSGYTTWNVKGQLRFSPPIKLFVGEVYGQYRAFVSTQDVSTTLRVALYNVNDSGGPSTKITNTEATGLLNATNKDISLPSPFTVPATGYYMIALGMEGGTGALDAAYAVQQTTVTQAGVPEVYKDFLWTTGSFPNTAYAGPTDVQKAVTPMVTPKRTA